MTDDHDDPTGARRLSESAASPCIRICRLDGDDVYCVGCLRTLDEIRRWSLLDEGGRRAILNRIEASGMTAACAEDAAIPPPTR